MGLTLETVVFYFLAVFIIAMSILTVTTQRIVRSATYLLFVLFGTAGIYFLLGYTFLGSVQIMVYAGGIVVLYVFSMLLAVLEKRAGFKLIQKDVFLNITGGIKINDTAVDLAVLCAVLSSNLDIAVPSKTCMTGEVGLAGEIRAVSRIERRIAEAHRLGFTRILIPKANAKSLQQRNYDIEIVPCDRVDHAFRTLFSQRQ